MLLCQSVKCPKSTNIKYLAFGSQWLSFKKGVGGEEALEREK